LKGAGEAPISTWEREELNKLRRENQRLKQKLKEQAISQNEGANSDNDSADSSEVSLQKLMTN
jgi:hypothetical protein